MKKNSYATSIPAESPVFYYRFVIFSFHISTSMHILSTTRGCTNEWYGCWRTQNVLKILESPRSFTEFKFWGMLTFLWGRSTFFSKGHNDFSADMTFFGLSQLVFLLSSWRTIAFVYEVIYIDISGHLKLHWYPQKVKRRVSEFLMPD